MALVARFGFENNSMLPENVSLIDNNISVNIPCDKFTEGRNNGTALVGYGYAMYDIANQVTKSFCGGVNIKTIPTNQIHVAYYSKLISTGSVHCTGSLISFGDASVKFDAYNSKFMLCVTESIIKTSSVFDWPIDSWIQVKCSIRIGSSQAISITLNGITLDAVANTSPSGKIYDDTLKIYSGMTQDMNITGVAGFIQVPSERCKFAIDDIAVNNSIQYGVAKDYGMPSFISCVKLIPSASSIISGWQSSTTASIIDSLSDSSSFIRGKLSDNPQLTIFPSNGNINQQSTISAINISYADAKCEGQTNLILNSYIKYSDCPYGVPLSTTKTSTTDTITPNSASAFDISKLFSNGIPIKYSHYKNYNFFGRKILGDVRYTSSITLGDPNQFTVLEYNNLIIDSTATIKKTLNCKGLFFYVNGTFILSGSILASNGMTSSADIAEQSDFIFYKNIKPIDLDTTSNIINTLDVETTTQPILSGSTISTDLSIYKKNLIGSSFATYFPGINGAAGYGGSACNAFNANGAIFGQMASSSIYGGGMSINNWTSSVAYNRYHGGGLIGVVAKNILIASTGKLLCSGTVSPEGWYGSGGGIVRLMYSNIYSNTGTVDVAGAGANGKGGNGTLLTTKISSLITGDTGIKCLLHFDSSSITDECKLATISTFGGGATISSSNVKFGQSSLYLNGSSYAIIASTAFAQVNSSDFEFDMWYYPLDVSAHRCIAHIHADTYRGLHAHISGGTIILDDGASTVPATPVVITTINTWYHIRISGDYYSNGNAILRVFVNGIKVNELVKNTYALNFATPTKFSLGKFFTEGALSNAYGYFDEFVFRNVVTTRESFTPPTTPESL